MMISTKGRYALRVLIYLGENAGDKLIPLKEIAADQEISLKYLERIMTMLSKADFVESLHGKGGGYKLKYPPEHYTLLSILELTEGTLAPVACLEPKENPCERKYKCRTLPIWQDLHKCINDHLEKITLADVLKPEK
ncbi:MAG: RrF2 family transcriptional regulator [Acutalibacteraceae bacterium]